VLNRSRPRPIKDAVSDRVVQQVGLVDHAIASRPVVTVIRGFRNHLLIDPPSFLEKSQVRPPTTCRRRTDAPMSAQLVAWPPPVGFAQMERLLRGDLFRDGLRAGGQAEPAGRRLDGQRTARSLPCCGCSELDCVGALSRRGTTLEMASELMGIADRNANRLLDQLRCVGRLKPK